jgi:U6 snRNA-associated Sm-like protein LSm8
LWKNRKKEKQPTVRTMSSLQGYLNKRVCVMTADSRVLVGTLAGSDTSTNLILKDTEERTVRAPDDDEPSSVTPMGLYLVRGDNVCAVGLVDEQLDASIDWTKVRGAPIGGVKHV